jgi:hypothetical protein
VRVARQRRWIARRSGCKKNRVRQCLRESFQDTIQSNWLQGRIQLCSCGYSGLHKSRSWPRTSASSVERGTPYNSTTTSDSRSTTPLFNSYQLPIQAPPRCRLPSSMRFTALLLYITLTLFLVTTTTAIPVSVSHARIHVQNRQSIPDQRGNTGNEPGPIRSQPPPFTPTPIISVNPATSIPTSATTTLSDAPQPTSTLTTGSSGDSNPSSGGGNLGLNPGPAPPPAPGLQVTAPRPNLSPGVLAGIASGGAVVLILTIGVIFFVYRRTRKPEIDEIPIRRSKLGSRLGRRMFGSLSSSRSPSRAESRSSSRASLTGDTREKRGEAIDKSMISRPKAAWLENGLLSVPKPLFMREERERVEDREKWVPRGAISAPRPNRPASAEPLGRLSGMGMGMGYLK